MFNVVELCADDDEQRPAPCKWGNVVVGHACYCHAEHWPEGPRKCPVYRNFGDSDLSKWHKRNWETVILRMFKGHAQDGSPISSDEPRPCMPDDDVGGCPMFEPRSTSDTEVKHGDV